MNDSLHSDLSGVPMLELFRREAENQLATLNNGLLELERGQASPELFKELMRATHSFKGAARIVNLPVAVHVAHTMEDCLVAAQKGVLSLGRSETDLLLRGADLLAQLTRRNETNIADWDQDNAREIEQLLGALTAALGSRSQASSSPPVSSLQSPVPSSPSLPLAPVTPSPSAPERVLRLNAENLNRLLGLAGESLVESRWLRPFTDSLQRVKRHHTEMSESLDSLRTLLQTENLSEGAEARLRELGVQHGGITRTPVRTYPGIGPLRPPLGPAIQPPLPRSAPDPDATLWRRGSPLS